jgi:hypothetical protein
MRDIPIQSLFFQLQAWVRKIQRQIFSSNTALVVDSETRLETRIQKIDRENEAASITTENIVVLFRPYQKQIRRR